MICPAFAENPPFRRRAYPQISRTIRIGKSYLIYSQSLDSMIAIRLISSLILSSFVLSENAFTSPKDNWLEDQKSSSDRKAFITGFAGTT